MMYRKLLFIAAILMLMILPVSAVYDLNLTPVAGTYSSASAVIPGGYVSGAAVDAVCAAAGYTSFTDVAFGAYDSGGVQHASRSNGGVWGDWTLPGTETNRYVQRAINCDGAHYLDVVYFYRTGYSWVPPANVTFSVSQTGNFTNKLSGVIITLSNGQTNTTAADGTALIRVTPNSSTYTYGATKYGYVNLAAQSLGGYGETGGTVFLEMSPQVGASKLVSIVAMQAGTDNFIDGFTANVKDTSDNHWTNGTYPAGVADIWTNTSTQLIGYVSANGYDSVTETYTTGADAWAEEWVVIMYPPTAANATVSTLRISITDYNTKLPLKGVNALLTSTGELGFTTTSGTVAFTVPNGTNQQVVFSKSGYKSITHTFTVTTLISDWDVELAEATVTTATPTPVRTYPNGSVMPDQTAVVTPVFTGAALQAYNQAQDQAMMQQLRDIGPGLIGLCILVIIIQLMGKMRP